MLSASNQHVIISVYNTIYIGSITFTTATYINIQAVELKTSKKIATKFYKNELNFIQPLKQPGIPATVESLCDFTLHELNRMSQLLSGCIFIQRFEIDYHNAMADITLESFIGFFMPGIDSGRFSESSIIVVSTSKSIYIFDVQVLGRIEKNIKEILEANVPKKIIHDSSRCADILKHKHNINLTGVFDTMVAHCSLGFDKRRISLDECLREHFNIPGRILMDQVSEPWQRRPLSSNNKIISAQNVIFLQKLQSKLTRIALKSIVETTTS